MLVFGGLLLWRVVMTSSVSCADLLDGDSLDPFAPVPARAPSPARPPPPAIVSSTTAPAKAEVDLFGADLFGADADLPPPPAAPPATAPDTAGTDDVDDEELPAPPAELTDPTAAAAADVTEEEPLPPPPPQAEDEAPTVQVDEAPARAKSPAVPDVVPSPIPSPTPEAPNQEELPPPQAPSPVPPPPPAETVSTAATDLFGGIPQRPHFFLHIVVIVCVLAWLVCYSCSVSCCCYHCVDGENCVFLSSLCLFGLVSVVKSPVFAGVMLSQDSFVCMELLHTNFPI